MQKVVILIFFIFSLVSYSKEIKTVDVDTKLIIIKIGAYNLHKNALHIVQNLSDKYDVLTLKGSDYNQYLVNIPSESFDNALLDAKQVAPDAYRLSKASFKTDGVILSPITSTLTEDKSVTDVGKPLVDMTSNDLSEDISITDANELLVDLNSSTQDIIKSNALKDINATQLDDIKNIITLDVKEPKNLLPDQRRVDLIDVVLQAISASHKIMSSREKMIQAKHNIDIAYANYYPSVDAAYSISKTELRPGTKKEDKTLHKAKYYGDEIYSLKLSQNLYAGGETQNNIERLRAQYLISKADFEKLLEEESLKAINSYIDVVFSRESLEANKKNMKELETILDIVKIKYNAGALSIGELSSIEASISNAKSQLSRTNSRYTNALEYFKFITGESFKETYPYEKVTQVELRDFNTLFESSLLNNTNLRAFEYEILSSKYNLKKLKSAFRPKVDFITGVEKVADKEDFENVEDSYYAKVILNYNLYNGGRDEAEYLKAYSVLKEKSFDKEAEVRKIKWSLEKFHTSLTSLQNNISNVENEVNASKSMVGSYWESFRHGEQDLHVLLQAQRQLNTAELDFIQTGQDSMKDYFEILRILGDLLNYFYINIDDENYLDMARANYRIKDNIIKNDATKDEIKNTHKVEEAINKKPETEVKTDISKENIVVVSKEEFGLETLLSFHENFLMQDPNSYTVVISKLKNPLDGLKMISQLHIEDRSFIYEFYLDKKIKTNIVYGIFKTADDANRSLNNDLNISELGEFSIEKVGKVQNEFRDFFKLSFLNADEVAKTKTKIKEPKVNEVLFVTNEPFKKEFLSAPKEYFTINITTLSSMDITGKIVKGANIQESSFAFYFGKENRWVKLMMGVYSTYEEAKAALDSLGHINIMYTPVIEKIALKQELYKKFNK